MQMHLALHCVGGGGIGPGGTDRGGGGTAHFKGMGHEKEFKYFDEDRYF
jgi:hypothetical protein